LLFSQFCPVLGLFRRPEGPSLGLALGLIMPKTAKWAAKKGFFPIHG
jgi:hypothetical protein